MCFGRQTAHRKEVTRPQFLQEYFIYTIATIPQLGSPFRWFKLEAATRRFLYILSGGNRIRMVICRDADG